LGVDLGQKQDYTAIAVVERAEGPAAPARSWLVARGSSIGPAGFARRAACAVEARAVPPVPMPYRRCPSRCPPVLPRPLPP
jgi:hypothetical protein